MKETAAIIKLISLLCTVTLGILAFLGIISWWWVLAPTLTLMVVAWSLQLTALLIHKHLIRTDPGYRAAQALDAFARRYR